MSFIKKITFFLILSVSIWANVFAQQNQYQVTISNGNRLMSQSEKFEFGIGNQKVLVDFTHPVAAFPNKFNAGQPIYVFQISGPRTCSFNPSNSQGSFPMPNQDLQISVNCGSPPTSLFSFEIWGLQIRETFNFTDNYGRSIQFTYSHASEPHYTSLSIPLGDSFLVTQTGGPRPCVMSNNQNVSPNQSGSAITANCRATLQQAQFRLGIKNVGQKTATSDKFEFSVGDNKKIILDPVHPEVYFVDKFVTGQTYTIKQLPGSRPCALAGSDRGTFGNQDILLTADCGSAPTANLKLKTVGIEPKETFTFRDNYNRTSEITGSTTTDLGGFTVGDNFYVTQEDGIRPCKLTNNRGTVSATDKNGYVVTADCSKTTTNGSFKLGVTYASSLFSNKERFEFMIGNNEKAVLDGTGSTVYFNSKFIVGQSYQINQITGPRTCNFFADRQGNFINQDIVVTADCGTPPLTYFKFEITGVESGEVFSFADGHGRIGSSYNSSTIRNWGAFPQGDDYHIIQKSGPRPCNLTNNQGVVPNTPVTVKANCSRTAGTIPTTNPETSGTPGTAGTPNPSLNPVPFDLISRSSDNKTLGTYFENWTPVIGGKGEDEGRYVAFVSQTPGIAGSTGKYRQIIWRDRKTGETRLVSASAAGGEGNQNSLAPAISADGKSVAFESYATNLVPIDTNGARDIFVWNADRNTITAVSTGQGETEANYQSYEPTISGDGKLVAFTSDASNLIPNILGQSSTNVYLKDITSGSIKIISLDEKTKKGGGGSNPSISEDGSRIAFYNYAPLTSDDKNNLWDIYLWESGKPKLKRISLTADGTDKNQGDDSASRVVAPSISGNGKFVAFATTATNVVGGDTNGLQDVFVVEVDSGRVIRASEKAGVQSDGDSPIGQGEKIAISYDGNWVVFSTKATNLGGNILIKSTIGNDPIPISRETGLTVSQPVMSRNGHFIVFGTSRQLDTRYQSSGIFAFYTGLNK